MIRQLVVACLALVTVPSLNAVPCLAAEEGVPRGVPEEEGMSGDRLRRLHQSTQKLIDDRLLAGAVTLVARNGKVVYLESQGHRQIETDDVMTDDTIFYIMSMTKPIVSVALMMLYEEGHFLLDDPITEWIPEIRGKEVLVEGEEGVERVPAARPVTFRHVLTHTSGLDPSRGHLSEEERSLLERQATLEETLLRRAPLPLGFQPGERWRYGSSTDYVALLVERISGDSLDVFLRDRIFVPLGMEDTFYNVPASKLHRVAAVYQPKGNDGNRVELRLAPEDREPTKYFGGTAGLYSTAADYFRFHQMMLNGGVLDGARLLGTKTVDLIISNHIDEAISAYEGYGFGLGYSVVTDSGKSSEPLTPGSFGWGGAWGTYFWVDPAENLQALVMAQLTRHAHLNYRLGLAVLVTQAVTESYRHRPPTVMGYGIEP